MNTNIIRHCIKSGAQWICASAGPHKWRHRRPSLLVLMYHRVLPLNDERARFEEPGMIVTPSTFRKHMGLVRRYFQPVHLAEWVEQCTNGEKLPNRACAITFDDGWADNHEFAFPILQETRMPATIFLVTDMIGSRKMFWPELLARILNALLAEPATRLDHPALNWLQGLLPANLESMQRCPDREELAVIINNAKSFTDKEINRQLASLVSFLDLEITPATPSLLNWEQVTEMTSTDLVQVASHTRNHTRLASDTPDSVLSDEIIGSKAIIDQQTGRETTCFCFPNGDHTPQALETVRKNYRCAVTTSSGWNACGDDMHLLQRIAIHEDKARNSTAFLSCISGWL